MKNHIKKKRLSLSHTWEILTVAYLASYQEKRQEPQDVLPRIRTSDLLDPQALHRVRLGRKNAVNLLALFLKVLKAILIQCKCKH
jgi:hypothetical protein